MNFEQQTQVVRALLMATRRSQIVWSKGEDDWYSTNIGNRKVAFRYLYFEATNQIGADPMMVELMMPGMSSAFACGTECYALFQELVDFAFPGVDYGTFSAIEFLRHAGIDVGN